jgi:hypothetical protein
MEEYDNGKTYGPGSVVNYDGVTYKMIIGIGAGGYAPPAYPNHWEKVSVIATPSSIGTAISNMFSSSTVGSSPEVTEENPEYQEAGSAAGFSFPSLNLPNLPNLPDFNNLDTKTMVIGIAGVLTAYLLFSK